MLTPEQTRDYHANAVDVAAKTTPEAAAALVQQLSEHPEFLVPYLLRFFREYRAAVFVLLANAGALEDERLRQILTVLNIEPGREEELDTKYRRQAGVFMPGQDPFEVLLQLVKYGHEASVLLRDHLAETAPINMREGADESTT